jgi:hypothetical protein
MNDAHSCVVLVSFGLLPEETAQQIEMAPMDVHGERHWFDEDSPSPVCSRNHPGV